MKEIICDKGKAIKVPDHQETDARQALPLVCVRFCIGGKCGFIENKKEFLEAFMVALKSPKGTNR